MGLLESTEYKDHYQDKGFAALMERVRQRYYEIEFDCIDKGEKIDREINYLFLAMNLIAKGIKIKDWPQVAAGLVYLEELFKMAENKDDRFEFCLN